MASQDTSNSRDAADNSGEVGPSSAIPDGADYDFDVEHDTEGHYFTAVLNGYEIGKINYTDTAKRFILESTVIINTFRHHGMATELIKRALDIIRDTGKTVTVLCPIIRAVIDANPLYDDLVDQGHPGIASQGN
jgi:predicted GNAT family acetyltransferase